MTADLQDVPTQFVDQSPLLLSRSLLQELLDGLVSEHVVADGDYVLDHLLEDDGLLLGSAVLDFLLDDPRPVLVQTEFHDVLPYLHQVEFPLLVAHFFHVGRDGEDLFGLELWDAFDGLHVEAVHISLHRHHEWGHVHLLGRVHLILLLRPVDHP